MTVHWCGQQDGEGEWLCVGVEPLTAAVKISLLVPTQRNLTVHHHTPLDLDLGESHLSPPNRTPLSNIYTNPSQLSRLLFSLNYTGLVLSDLRFEPFQPAQLLYLWPFISKLFFLTLLIIPLFLLFLNIIKWVTCCAYITTL